MSSTPRNIRNRIETAFENVLKKPSTCTIQGLKKDAYGHEAGMPFENWIRANLEEPLRPVKVYSPEDFLLTLFTRIGRDVNRIKSVIKNAWWGSIQVTEQQIRDYVGGKGIGRWQQEAGDIVLFYGTDILQDIDDVILLNVKSHDIERLSRHPNIMSAARLLKFFNTIIGRLDGRDEIEKVNIWIIGIYYEREDTSGVISEIYTHDLLRLDLDELPQINFDAAIQIQWHVRDMIETKQNRLDFVGALADKFIEQWKQHIKTKERYVEMAGKIRNRVTEIQNQP